MRRIAGGQAAMVTALLVLFSAMLKPVVSALLAAGLLAALAMREEG